MVIVPALHLLGVVMRDVPGGMLDDGPSHHSGPAGGHLAGCAGCAALVGARPGNDLSRMGRVLF